MDNKVYEQLAAQPWLKNTVARKDGFYTKSGEKLKGMKLDQEFCDKWNGVKTASDSPKENTKKVSKKTSKKKSKK